MQIRFKADRLQMTVVAKNISVLQLFISRMPKMCAILQLVSAPLNPIPIAEHFRRSHPQCEHSCGHHNVDTKWRKITKIDSLMHDFFCIELKLFKVVTLITKFHVYMSPMTFPWQITTGSRPSPFKGQNQSFPPSRSVICFCCSFNGCEWIWTVHSTSTRKYVKLWRNIIKHFLILGR